MSGGAKARDDFGSVLVSPAYVDVGSKGPMRYAAPKISDVATARNLLVSFM